MNSLEFTLNGRPCRTEAPDHWTALDLLRDGLALTGAKGIGEPAMTPTPAAVMNAVSRAAGAPLTQFPLTAERVLAALKSPSPLSGPSNPSPPLGERAG